MRVYKSKEEIKAEINKTFEKYISEFDCMASGAVLAKDIFWC